MTKEQTRMLAYLTEHVGSWVNARELTPIACAYCRVIRELRAMGHHIANRVERDDVRVLQQARHLGLELEPL